MSEERDAADLVGALWRQVHRRSAARLEPLGVTQAQVRALRAIARAGTPVRMGDLASRLQVAPRSATSLVDPLVEAGLVARRHDPTDRRAAVVVPTAAGTRLLESVRTVRREVTAELLAPLSAAERRRLVGLLGRVLDAAEDHRPE